MKLRYETGFATYIQFIVVSLLALLIQVTTIVSSCIHTGTQCVEDIIPSIGYFIVTAVFFAAIWFLGYTAQEKRNKWLALALIGVELVVGRVAYHNAKHHTDTLSLVASIIDALFAVFIIYLAVRLYLAKGGRVVSKPRARRRRTPTAAQ